MRREIEIFVLARVRFRVGVLGSARFSVGLVPSGASLDEEESSVVVLAGNGGEIDLACDGDFAAAFGASEVDG